MTNAVRGNTGGAFKGTCCCWNKVRTSPPNNSTKGQCLLLAPLYHAQNGTTRIDDGQMWLMTSLKIVVSTLGWHSSSTAPKHWKHGKMRALDSASSRNDSGIPKTDDVAWVNWSQCNKQRNPHV